MASWEAVRRLVPRRPATLALLIAATALLLAVVAVVAIRVAGAPSDRVPPGVSIAGVPVGGMTPDQAERAVSTLAAAATGDVVVESSGEEGFPISVPMAELAPTPRAKLAVARAMKQPSVGRRIMRELGFGADRDIPLSYRVAPAPLAALVTRVQKLLTVPPRNAAVRVEEGALVLVAARDGRRVRTERFEKALRKLPRRVAVPTAPVKPAVGDAEARRVRAAALRMVQGPVTVAGAGRSTIIPRQTLIGALRFTRSGDTIEVALAQNVIGSALGATIGSLTRDPVSATFRVSGAQVAVVPGREGRRLDVAAVTRALEKGRGKRSVRVRMSPVAPDRSTADARAMGIRRQISEFSTPYTCCQPRVTNIKRGAALIDGTIIPAGGTFSLNDAMGERTRARGFLPAPQINAGELEDAVGGGVSQIATTVYNAAFFGGMNLVSHTPHEFWITRYPAGREATVSWGGPELIFENDWSAAVLLKATATDTGITIRLYSSPLGRRVTTTSSGNEVAGTAFTSTYTRKVFEGATLKRDETYTWAYKAPPAG